MKTICGIELYKDKYVITSKNEMLEILNVTDTEVEYIIHSFWYKLASKPVKMRYSKFERLCEEEKITRVFGQDKVVYKYVLGVETLKWSDLDFDGNCEQEKIVRYNNKIYLVRFGIGVSGREQVLLFREGEIGRTEIFDKVFFDDLNLEVIE